MAARTCAAASWAVAGALVFFAACACLFVSGMGIYEDEVLFVYSFYHPTESIFPIELLGHQFPTMILSYLGAEKAYLYWPILKGFAPSVWSLRLPVVLIGALTAWLLFVAVRRFTADYVAAALACLIATDPIFLLTTTLDWGPVALQHLLLAVALVCLTRRQPMISAGFFALGAALWDKGTAAWTIVAMAISAAVFLPAMLRPHLTTRAVARAFLGLAIGGLPLWIYNLAHPGTTVGENAIFTTAGVGAKVMGMLEALDGRVMFLWLLHGGTPRWWTLTPCAFAVALLVMLRRQSKSVRPVAFFVLFTGLLTWLMMLFMKAGGAPHHVALVWPWPHLFLVCVLGVAWRKDLFLAMMTLIVLSNMVMIGLYAQRMYAFGPREEWSKASLALPSILPDNRKVVTLDWGIRVTGTYLTRGKALFEERAVEGLQVSDLPELERTQFLTHSPGAEEFAGSNARSDDIIRNAGYERVVDQTLADPFGRPVIVSFHVARMALFGKAGGFSAVSPDEQVKIMGRGLNILGVDPIWDDFRQAWFQERHFERIYQAGFRTVRVNLESFRHMDRSKRLSADWFQALDWVVKSALSNHLQVILDEHDFHPSGADPAASKPKLLAFWQQVAQHYQDAPNAVIFEILDEPNGQLTTGMWNEWLEEALAVIRKTNPLRNVVIGPASWNDIGDLDELRLPEGDGHLIATVHYYLPMEFTHQGVSWNEKTVHLSGIKWGTDAEKKKVVDDFAGVQRWAVAHHRPILLGEFGAYEKGGLDSRVQYTAHVARAAERFGWAWTYYQFNVNFDVWDMAKDDWVLPIRKALIP
jgi:endoglucanase